MNRKLFVLFVESIYFVLDILFEIISIFGILFFFPYKQVH